MEVCMNQTPNFQLNLWDKTDRIMVEDFNADNAKIEAALSGIPKIATGTYTGKGTYGSGNKNSLTFDFQPAMVIIVRNGTNSPGAGTILLYGQTQSAGTSAQYNGYSLELTVAWSGNTVTWYSAQNADRQLNASGTYRYLALGI